MAEDGSGVPRGAADVLAVGFGTSVAAWSAGYVCRFPGVDAPGAIALLLVAACFVAGGFVGGRFGARGVRGGAYAGLVAGLVNLLVLGGLLGGRGSDTLVPSVLLWLPGSIAAAAALGALGAALGVRAPSRATAPPDWTGALAWVAAAATFLLVVVGGVVTSNRAGLAVIDWPNSFGTNMFLYPLARMTGGIFYEHAHRLFGSLVGLTTLVLFVHLRAAGERPAVKRLALAALGMVLVQGVLGGLRVTGHLTSSQDPGDTAPSVLLAVVHGAFGQCFFATMVALAVRVSRTFVKEGTPRDDAGRSLSALVVGLLLVQLVLGAVERHVAHGLMLHIAMAAVVVPAAILVGLRNWLAHFGDRASVVPGAALAVLAGVQLVLGVATWLAIGQVESGTVPGFVRIVLATVHQANGALLLAAAALLLARSYGRLAPPA